MDAFMAMPSEVDMHSLLVWVGAGSRKRINVRYGGKFGEVLSGIDDCRPTSGAGSRGCFGERCSYSSLTRLLMSVEVARKEVRGKGAFQGGRKDILEYASASFSLSEV